MPFARAPVFSTRYACFTKSTTSGRVSRGSMISSAMKASAVRNGERIASNLR